jgi:uncharacterized protein (DUF2267 family)
MLRDSESKGMRGIDNNRNRICDKVFRHAINAAETTNAQLPIGQQGLLRDPRQRRDHGMTPGRQCRSRLTRVTRAPQYEDPVSRHGQ